MTSESRNDVLRDAINRLNSMANYGKLPRHLKKEVQAIADSLTPEAVRSASSETARSIDADVRRVMDHPNLFSGLQHFRNGNWSEETLVRLICQLAAPTERGGKE